MREHRLQLTPSPPRLRHCNLHHAYSRNHRKYPAHDSPCKHRHRKHQQVSYIDNGSKVLCIHHSRRHLHAWTRTTTMTVFVIVIPTTINTFYIVYCRSFIVCYFVIGGFTTATPTFENTHAVTSTPFTNTLYRIPLIVHIALYVISSLMLPPPRQLIHTSHSRLPRRIYVESTASFCSSCIHLYLLFSSLITLRCSPAAFGLESV